MFAFLLAATLTLPALPPAGHADCEAATNVVLKASAERRELAFDLAVSATASNSVEVAFGRDADEDGDLSRHEADLVVGWRCGSWFVVDGATGGRTDAEGAPGERELHWRSWASADDSLRSVSAKVGGVELFPALAADPPRCAYGYGWTHMKVVARGVAPGFGGVSVTESGGKFGIYLR